MTEILIKGYRGKDTDLEAGLGENVSAEIQLLMPQPAYTKSDRIVELWSCYSPVEMAIILIWVFCQSASGSLPAGVEVHPFRSEPVEVRP
jgi:hypothetical protein